MTKVIKTGEKTRFFVVTDRKVKSCFVTKNLREVAGYLSLSPRTVYRKLAGGYYEDERYVIGIVYEIGTYKRRWAINNFSSSR